MSKDDYEVGYGKPPKHSQFKKGESGRHRARTSLTPRVKRTIDDVVREIAARKIKVREGDTVREALLSNLLVERTLLRGLNTNNPRHLRLALEMLERADAFGDREMTDEENMQDFIRNSSAKELAQIDEILEKFAAYRPKPGQEEEFPQDEGGEDG